MSNDIRRRLIAIQKAQGPRGTLRLDVPELDCSYLYAGGEAGFEMDWLKDPEWRELAHDDAITIYRHKTDHAMRAVYVNRLTDDELAARGGSAFV